MNTNYLGFDIELIQDQDAERPDQWDNDFAFLVYDHRSFTVEVKGFDPSDIFEAYEQGRKLFKGYFIFPVYAYIHSGVALSLGRNSYPFTCGFDTSFKGFALVRREKGTWTPSKARKVAEGVVSEWNTYLSGDVWGYVVSKDGEELDSCWGFYGEKYALEEAQGIAAWHFNNAFKKRCELVKTWIKNRVPLDVRAAN